MAFLAGMFLLITVNGFAQTLSETEFFIGKWVGMTEGAPMGDMKIIISLERKDSTLGGLIKLGDQDEVKITNAEEKESTVILVFTSSHGYEVTLTMTKKDENNVEGTINTSMMGGITFSGTRETVEGK